MSTLILYLPESLPPEDGASPVLQHVLTHDGRSVATQAASALNLLTMRDVDGVVVIVPAARLSWQRVQLPTGTLTRKGLADPVRLRMVLSGAMEELLLDDPEALHFALSPQARDNEPCSVAVCDRAWMRAWMQVLEVHDCSPARIVPELSPVDETSAEAAEVALHVFAREDRPWAAWSSEGSLVVLPLDTVSAQLLCWPEGAAVLAEPAVAAQAERVLGRHVGLQSQADRWLAAARTHWNLGQLEWANARSRRNWRRAGLWLQDLWQAPRWRVARWAGLAVVLVNLIGLNAWAWVHRSSLKAKQEQVSSILQQTFPAVKVVIDAPVQMRKELTLRRQNSGHSGAGDAETLLTAAAAAGVSQAVPAAIDYAAGELRLRAWVLTDGERAAARHRLAAQGVDLRFQDGVAVLRPKESP